MAAHYNDRATPFRLLQKELQQQRQNPGGIMKVSNRAREWTLVILVAITAAIANMPEETLSEIGVNRNYVLGFLALVVFIALFLYLKFQFFFMVVLLALGANMPGQIAESLGISRWPLIIALALMIGVALINYVVAMLPTGLEPKERQKSPEGIKALFYAIEKGNLTYAQKILNQNYDPNMFADNGYTPLMYAAARGDAKMCDLLLRNGASVTQMSKDGDTAIELALKVGSSECADLLKTARAEQLAREEALKGQAKAA
jgi:ankyrin repeat protein